MLKPNVLILSGDGINCEEETAKAFQLCGADTEKVHVNDLIEMSSGKLRSYHIVALPGGFSFGDELGSGKILSLKISHKMKDFLNILIESRMPVIGICNGFQVLCELGVFGEYNGKINMSLTENESSMFINRWVTLKVNPKVECLWLKSLDELSMPVRHKEGKVIFSEQYLKNNESLVKNKMIALRYNNDINGSYDLCAGVTNEKGNILGLMPHPEAAIEKYHFPEGMDAFFKQNRQIFQNAVDYAKEC